MIAYKGFDKDLSCTSGGHKFQYKLGVVNKEPQANCRSNGFHCAENPLDCLSYYPNTIASVYYMVQASGDIDEDDIDSKISCTEMTLIKQLTLEELVKGGLAYMVKHPLRKNATCVKSSEKNGYRGNIVVVRDKYPYVAAEQIGTVIGLAREKTDSADIDKIAVFTIDGEKYKPGITYGIRRDDNEA